MSLSTNMIKFGLLFLVFVCCCQGATAQGLTGQISGKLYDPNGGVVPNAKIEVINQETAQSRMVNSDDDGNFVITQLLPGPYTLFVSVSGFKKFEQKGIILSANERVDVHKITLEVGAVSETVSVTADPAYIKTEGSERAGLIDEQQIQGIALKGRDYMGMLRLLPG